MVLRAKKVEEEHFTVTQSKEGLCERRKNINLLQYRNPHIKTITGQRQRR